MQLASSATQAGNWKSFSKCVAKASAPVHQSSLNLPWRVVVSNISKGSYRCSRVSSTLPDKGVDLESEVEAFMRRQAEMESGVAFARAPTDSLLGADLVPEETAKQYCRDIVDTLKLLRTTRDMSVNEARLIIAIEDPRAKERRAMGIEDERGVSRDEMSAALQDIVEGRVPRDRVALKCLYDEISSWPYLEVGPDGTPPQETAKPTSDYASLADGGKIAKPYIMGKEARGGDQPQSLEDMLPDWVGYAGLYGFSLIPVFLAVGAVLILFYNSLK